MLPLPFEKLKASLINGCFFSHTNVDNAEQRLTLRLREQPTKVNIAIIGDDHIERANPVCKAIISILEHVGSKDDISFIVGDDNRCARIVKTFASKSNIESYVINQRTEENWKSETTPYQEMIDTIIDMADIVIFLTSTAKGSRHLQYPYSRAVVDGCFVTRRIIKRSNNERSNDSSKT